MAGMLVFLIPALWQGYLIGEMLRPLLAMILYYMFGDVTVWLLDHWSGLVWWGLGLALMGNLILTTRIRWGKWERTLWALPLVLAGGACWLAACMLRPEWIFAPFDGLVVFAALMMTPLAALMGHFAMRSDDILTVLGWMLMFTGATAIVQAGVWWWIG